jgi:hypothetical protein
MFLKLEIKDDLGEVTVYQLALVTAGKINDFVTGQPLDVL